MDAFTLALSYGINKVSFKNVIVTAFVVGMFHFFMPLLGNIVGISLFNYTVFKPRYVLFFIFLILSIDMIIKFFEGETKLRTLNTIGIIFFAISVSIDSFSVGLGINYFYDNVIFASSVFCIISASFTIIGFKLGQTLFKHLGKYAMLLGGAVLFLYSIRVLTK